MINTKNPTEQSLRTKVLRIIRAHFFYVAAYILVIVAYDLWELLTPEAIMWRIVLSAVVLVSFSGVWIVARRKTPATIYYNLIRVLVVIDILMASFNIYFQRGMASRAVALFAIPIAVSSLLPDKNAPLKTAGFCATAYALTAALYFKTYFNEGYQVELYGEVSFYCAIFFILAYILSTLKHE